MPTPVASTTNFVKSLKEKQHLRTLAGDRRAGRWPQEQARRECWAFVRKSRWHIAGLISFAALVIGLCAWFVSNTFVRGAIVGGGCVATAAVIFGVTLYATGTVATFAGADAERWTAAELRPLMGAGWRVINDVKIGRGNIDHVLIGPGGVITIETKWSAHDWNLQPDDRWLKAPIWQATESARMLGSMCTRTRRGQALVRPAIFLWSAVRSDLRETPDAPIVLPNVTLIRGRQSAEAWRAKVLTSERQIDDDAVDAIWTEIVAHARREDARAAARQTSPPSLSRMYWTAVASACVFLGTIWASLGVFTATHSYALWGLATAALAGLAATTARVRLLRGVGLSGLAASFVTTALFLFGTILDGLG